MRVLRLQQAPPLQGRGQPVGDFGDRPARQRILDQEAVTADLLHHLMHLGGDAVGGANEVEATAAGIQHHLTQRLRAVARQVGLERRSRGVGLHLGQRCIEIEFGEVDHRQVRHAGQPHIDGLFQRRRHPRPLVIRLRHRLADDHRGIEQHLAIARLAALRLHQPGDVLAVLPGAGDAALLGDDQVGVLGGERAAGRRAASLADHRAALRTGCRVQRSARLVEPPGVMDRVDLGVVGEHACLGISQDRVRLPRRPQPVDDVQPFVRHLIAQVVLVVPVEAEVLRREIVVRRHDVEADASLGELVEGRAEPGGDIGRVEARGDGGDDAHPTGDIGQQRHQGKRIALRHRVGVAQIPFRRSPKGFRDERPILHDQAVEAGALEAASQIHVKVGLHPVAADGAGPWLVPAMGRVPSPDEPAEMEHAASNSRRCNSRARNRHASRQRPISPTVP